MTSLRPFPGLRSFRADEAHLFFGREGQSHAVIRRMVGSRFIALVGTSGCGKSSLVRAGLLPDLYAGRFASAGSKWFVADFRPGSDPTGRLRAALDPLAAGDGDPLTESSSGILEAVKAARACGKLGEMENVLILADQFEELFRYTVHKGSAPADHDEKAHFVRLLTEAAKGDDPRVYILITVRADYLGDCAQYRDLPEAINSGQYLVPRMTRLQCQSAIESPVRVVGGKIASRLTRRMLNELGDAPDQLPVLQHALMRTWDVWHGRDGQGPMDFKDYEQTGGLELALSRHADEVLAEAARCVEGGETALKRMFQRLRERDPNGREIRQPTPVKELAQVAGVTPASAIRMLDFFRDDGAGATFLAPLKTDVAVIDEQDEIDVTHESLLRKWTKLAAEWVPEEEQSRRIYMRLADRAEGDSKAENPLTGPILDRTLEWWNERQPIEIWALRYHPGFVQAKAFLYRSVELRHQEEEEKERERRDAEAKRIEDAKKNARTRLLYILQGGTAIALVVMAALSVATYRARKSALTNLMASRAALAATESDTSLPASLLLAAESLRREPSVEARALVMDGLDLLATRDPRVVPVTDVRQASFAGEDLYTLDGSGKLQVWNFAERKERAVLPVKVTRFAIGDEESGLVTADEENLVQLWLWDRESLQARGSATCAAKVSLLAIGGTTVAALCDGRPMVWKVDGRGRLKSLPAPRVTKNPKAAPAWGLLSLDSDGRYLILGRAKRQPDSGGGDTIAASRDESFDDSSFVVTLTETGVKVAGGGGEDARLTAVASTATGLSTDDVVTADVQGNVSFWTTQPGKTSSDKGVAHVVSGAISALWVDMARVISGGHNGVARVWDGDEETARVVDGAPIAGVTFDSDNELALVTLSGELRLWTLSHGVAKSFGGFLSSAHFSLDGSLLVYRDLSNAGIYDLQTKRDIAAGKVRKQYPVAIAPDRTLIVLREPHPHDLPTITVAPIQDGKFGAPKWSQPVRTGIIGNPVFSVDSSRIAWFEGALPTWPRTRPGIHVWNVAKATEEAYFPDESGSPRTAPAFCFTPDGKKLLIASRQKGILEAPIPGEPVSSRIAPDRAVTALAFSPDHRTLVTGEVIAASRDDSSDEESQPGYVVRVWDYATVSEDKAPERTVFTVPSPIRFLSYSSDSHRLIAGTSREVRVFDLTSGQLAAQFKERDRIFGAAVTSTGDLAVAFRKGLAIYPWDPVTLRDQACERVGRNLTAEEWKHYLPGEKPFKICPHLP